MAIRVTVCIHGLFSRFVTIGRYGKWLTDINLLLHPFILIRQMAAEVIIIAISRDIATLVRRALAEVCTVSMLLVCYYYAAWLLQQLCTTVQAMTIPANLHEY